MKKRRRRLSTTTHNLSSMVKVRGPSKAKLAFDHVVNSPEAHSSRGKAAICRCRPPWVTTAKADGLPGHKLLVHSHPIQQIVCSCKTRLMVTDIFAA